MGVWTFKAAGGWITRLIKRKEFSLKLRTSILLEPPKGLRGEVRRIPEIRHRAMKHEHAGFGTDRKCR